MILTFIVDGWNRQRTPALLCVLACTTMIMSPQPDPSNVHSQETTEANSQSKLPEFTPMVWYVSPSM
jgi:hypothetical protein